MDVSLLIRLIDQVSGPAKKVVDGLRGIGSVAGEMKRGFGEAIKQGFSVENIETATQNAEAALDRARGRLLGAFGMAFSLAAPIKKSAEFDQSMRGLDKVLDVTHSRLRELRKFALDTSAMVPIAAGSLVELMSEAAQGGVPEKELEAFSLYVARAAVAFDMAGGEIGERFAKLRNVYKLNQGGIEDLGDATNHLSNNMAAKASELTDFANRAAGAASIFKLTATEATAVGASMIAAGIVPESAARGFTAMATRILSGGKKIDSAFKQIGMNRKAFLKDLEEDAPAALQKLFTTMSKSPKGMQALVELVGQDFADDFAKLLGNPELLAQAFELVGDKAAYAGSATEEAAKQGEGAVKKWELLTGKLNRLAITVGDRLLPMFLELTDSIGGTIDKIAAFADANPAIAEGAVKAVAALMALSVAGRLLSFGVAAIRLPLIKVASAFLKFDSTGRNVALGWRLMSGAGRGLAAALVAIARHVPAIRRAAIALTMLSAVARGGLIGAGFTLLASAIGVVGAALAAITAPAWALIGVLVLASAVLWKYWQRVSNFAAGFASVFSSLFAELAMEAARLGDRFLDWTAKVFNISPGKVAAYKAAARAAFANVFDFSGLIDGVKAKLTSFWEWLGGMFSQEMLSANEQAEMYAAGQRLAQNLVEGIREWISEKLGSIQELLSLKLDVQWPQPPEWLQWLIDQGSGAVGTVAEKATNFARDISGGGAPPGPAGAGATGILSGDFTSNLKGALGLAGDDLAAGASRGGDAVARGGEEAENALVRGARQVEQALSRISGAIASVSRGAVAGSGVRSAISDMKNGSYTGGTE